MTFAPPKKASKTQTGRRYGKWLQINIKRVKNLISLQYDAEGNAIGLSHFASPVTGMYRGRKVLDVGKKGSVKKIRA